jgi:hypothetical protein
MPKKIFTIVVYIFAFIGFVLVGGYVAVRFGVTNTSGIVDSQREAFLANAVSSQNPTWASTPEWQTLEAAIRRDAPTIQKAADDSGVPARLIAANLVAEQLRLFFTEREFYKQFFFPLKILGSQTQFSWGVMGMKEDTAIAVENNLKDSTSAFYPGARYANLLDFASSTSMIDNQKEERFTRMTDQLDHYWSYLYAGLYMKEVETEWANAGFPIADNPAVVSTLYNIGFANSHPNANPQVGGAAITLGNETYSFGGLALDFYNSNLLLDIFPR